MVANVARISGISILQTTTMSAALNRVKKRNIEGVDTACAYAEQFGSGSQSSNVVELQEGKVYS